jgi:hypothetical protein
MVEQLQQTNRLNENKSKDELEVALQGASAGGSGGNGGGDSGDNNEERVLLRVRVGELEGRLEAVRDEKKLGESRLRSLVKERGALEGWCIPLVHTVGAYRWCHRSRLSAPAFLPPPSCPRLPATAVFLRSQNRINWMM